MAHDDGQEHEVHGPGWHADARTPVIDGRYYDPKTGELRAATGHQEYLGPPAVDIIIRSQHEDTTQCVFRASRSFRVEALLCQMMEVVRDQKLEIDSLNATPYAIRIILCSELTVDDFYAAAFRMANGLLE